MVKKGFSWKEGKERLGFRDTDRDMHIAKYFPHVIFSPEGFKTPVKPRECIVIEVVKSYK